MDIDRLDDFENSNDVIRLRVSRACERFEAVLQNGGSARAEDYLGDPGPGDDVCLRELLLVECEYRCRRGDLVSPDELTSRFPNRVTLVAGLPDLARRYATAGSAVGLTHLDGSPAVIGPYRLVRQVGQGGFGIVFLAVEVASGQTVALKIPHAAILLTPGLRDWFLRETQAAQQLDHPRIVRFLAAGEAGLVCYLATEFVPGCSLAEWLERRTEPVPPMVAAELLIALAAAVQHAHDHGVLHRDLKPANVLLENGSILTPKLTDFGMARLADAPDITHTGVIVGTPAYMAPEQAAGKRQNVTVRTDVYALGVILYEVLTGRPPFSGENAVDIVRRVLTEQPVRPRAISRQVPSRLQAVCLKCLEKSPARRYASATELAEDLGRFVTGKRPRARSPGPLRRSRWWVLRHRVGSVSLAAAILLAVGSVLGLAAHARRLDGVNQGLTTALAERDAKNHVLRRSAYAAAVRRADALLERGEVANARRLLDEWKPKYGEEELRGWEWYYLDHRIGQAEVARWDVGKAIYSLAFSPDGRALAGGGDDGQLHVWEPATGQDIIPPLRHPAGISRIAWTPNGQHLVTACDDGKVRVWPRDGGVPLEFTEQAGRVSALAISPNGRTAATAGVDGAVRIWDFARRPAASRVCVREHHAARAVAFTPDGANVIVGWHGSNRQVVNAATGQILATFTGSGSLPVAIRVSVTNNRFVSVERQHLAAWTWDTKTSEVNSQTLFPGQESRVNDAALSADGRTLAVVGDSPIRIWDLDGPHLRFQLDGHEGRVWATALHPAGQILATAGADGTVRLWSLAAASAAQEPLVLGSGDFLKRVALVAGTMRLAVARRQPDTIEFWNWGTAGPRLIASGPTPPLGQLVPAVDRPAVLSCDDLGQVRRFDFREGGSGDKLGAPAVPGRIDPTVLFRLPKQPDLPVDFPQPVSMSPDGQSIAAAFRHEIHFWQTATKQPLTILSGHRSPVTSLAFHPNGTTMLSGAKDGICLWDIANSFQRRALPGGQSTVEALAYSPDGSMFASSGDDQLVRLWDAEGVERQQFVGHHGRVGAIVFAADGRTLASGSDDGALRLWQVDTGTEMLTFSGTGMVWYTAFSSDGRYLAYLRLDDHNPHQAVVRLYDCGRPLTVPRRP